MIVYLTLLLKHNVTHRLIVQYILVLDIHKPMQINCQLKVLEWWLNQHVGTLE